MIGPVTPLPPTATAIFLLPAGLRAYDDELTVAFPPPRALRLLGVDYDLIHLHHAGEVDGETRALYVLGGTYLPHGWQAEPRHDPDEAHEQ